MSPAEIFFSFAEYLQSDAFRQSARHPEHPSAFTRTGGKLPPATLVALLLTGMRMSIRAELDQFFAHLRQQAQLVRHASEQAFAQARAKLSGTAIPELNSWLIRRLESAALIPRWHGLRLVAADASNLRFGLRACHRERAAKTEQNAFGLYLPGSEMMLAASLYDTSVSERQMLFEHLSHLDQNDLLLLDRGYPARWLIAALNQKGIRFCMRVERKGRGGFTCVREFLRSARAEAIVTLNPPDARDAADYECPATPQVVRLVRHIAPNGAIRVLMTNLLDVTTFPAVLFGDLYHQRWRIEEAFKRLKHRLCLEHVTGLSQLAVIQDFAARVLCDNLQALACLAATEDTPLPPDRRINHAYAHTVMKRVLPALLVGVAATALLTDALKLITTHLYRHRSGQSKPRPPRDKPHKHMNQKAC